MKKTIVTVLTISFTMAFVAVFGQVEEGVKAFSAGSENALTIRIPNSNQKEVEKLWKKYLKPYKGKTKRDRKSKEYFTDDATIPDLSMNTIDVYALANEAGNEVIFSVWFDLGGGFLSSSTHPDTYPQAEKMMLLFALEVSEKVIGDDLKSEEKNLKKMEKDLVKLQKRKEGLLRDIENYKQRIKDAEAAIKQNEVEQINAGKAIENQKLKVDDVKKKLEAVQN